MTRCVLSDDNGLEHIDSLHKSNYTVQDVVILGFEDSDVKSVLLLIGVCSELELVKLNSIWTLNLT